jgi:hypothetical protein
VRWHRGSGIASTYHNQIFFKVALGVGICETGGGFPIGPKIHLMDNRSTPRSTAFEELWDRMYYAGD